MSSTRASRSGSAAEFLLAAQRSRDSGLLRSEVRAQLGPASPASPQHEQGQKHQHRRQQHQLVSHRPRLIRAPGAGRGALRRPPFSSRRPSTGDRGLRERVAGRAPARPGGRLVGSTVRHCQPVSVERGTDCTSSLESGSGSDPDHAGLPLGVEEHELVPAVGDGRRSCRAGRGGRSTLRPSGIPSGHTCAATQPACAQSAAIATWTPSSTTMSSAVLHGTSKPGDASPWSMTPPASRCRSPSGRRSRSPGSPGCAPGRPPGPCRRPSHPSSRAAEALEPGRSELGDEVLDSGPRSRCTWNWSAQAGSVSGTVWLGQDHTDWRGRGLSELAEQGRRKRRWYGLSGPEEVVVRPYRRTNWGFRLLSKSMSIALVWVVREAQSDG